MNATKVAATKSGMTLIEVMIGVVFIAIGLSAIYTSIAQGTKINYGVAQRVAAFSLCKETLEQMHGATYDHVTTVDFPTETVKLTHLGGSARVPLYCTRSSQINSLINPSRKEVKVSVAWDFRGQTLSESVDGVIYYKDFKTTALTGGGSIGGKACVRTNEAAGEFHLAKSDGSEINKEDLTEDFPPYTGPACLVHILNAGGGSQFSLSYNGNPYTMLENKTYDIISDVMTVNLYNDNPNGGGLGKATGAWWISVTATDGTITVR